MEKIRKNKKREKRKTSYKLENKDTVKRVNAVIKQTKNREGLWRTKNEIEDRKMRKNSENCDALNTYGGWKNKVYGVAKSQIQRRIENGELAPNWHEMKRKSVKIKTHEAIILYEKETGNCDAYNAEVEKENGEITVKIINGRRKIKVKAHEEVIENEEIIKIALENRARIYIIDEVMA